MTTDPLLTDIEAALVKTGIAPATFGKDAVGDPNLIPDLRSGREPRRVTRNKIIAHLNLILSPPADPALAATEGESVLPPTPELGEVKR